MLDPASAIVIDPLAHRWDPKEIEVAFVALEYHLDELFGAVAVADPANRTRKVINEALGGSIQRVGPCNREECP